jgi:hypothetical protein
MREGTHSRLARECMRHTLNIAVMESDATACFCCFCLLAFFLESCRFLAFLPMLIFAAVGLGCRGAVAIINFNSRHCRCIHCPHRCRCCYLRRRRRLQLSPSRGQDRSMMNAQATRCTKRYKKAPRVLVCSSIRQRSRGLLEGRRSVLNVSDLGITVLPPN